MTLIRLLDRTPVQSIEQALAVMQAIARIRFALAGMTAHINRDLPDGIVQSFLALGGDPITGELREQDFDSIHEILERVEGEVKAECAVGVVGAVDRLGGQVADAVAMWKVRTARSAASTNAQVLWACAVSPVCVTGSFTGSTAWLE